ncbi:DUF1642 domain-containing protein [Streptococcus anginosus]|uniref:DUF1642 domain-containing protein n=1 Tax=Streptococcus anginosus TaxID=1328 RepID=UPI00124886FC|nr:DUF1642 domain-containing protein [Streptococcus anginosus]KAA9317820.1 DUF1642 domain-containing protein [Streptococcus anginosus]
MKYKLGDEVYLKGVITSINSCAEIKYLYEVKTADEFVTAAERHLEPINKEEAPLYLRNVLARLRELPEHDREVWLKGIMDEFELDFSHAKWREGYEQGKFDGAVEAEKSNKVVLTKEEEDYLNTFGLSNKHEVRKALYFISRSGWGYSLQNGYGDRNEGLLAKITHDEDDENSTRTKLIKAVLFGYDVEQEKRYEVKLKNTGDYLVKTDNDDYHFYNNIYTQNRKHTRKELEDAGFGWVFDCEGVEVREVE